MTKIGIAVVVIIATIVSIAMINMTRSETLKDVIYSSIVWVESKGDDKAKSRDGSVGIIQIKPVMVTEVNRICKIMGFEERFTLADRFDKQKSQEMFWIYQEFYHPHLDWETLTKKDMESIARKWNGGPKGHVKRSTRKYWAKIERQLHVELQARDLNEI